MKSNKFTIIRLLFAGLVFSSFLLSCELEQIDELVQKNHDSSEMMMLMHKMMDKMDTMTMTGDPDNDFAIMMKSHHQGAIDMGELQIKKGKDSTLKQISKKMIEDQKMEIMELDSFLKTHPPVKSDHRVHLKGEKIMANMGRNADLQIIYEIDNDFARLMIQHHQAAIEMAGLEIQYGFDKELKKMASKMINEQRNEIAKLQKWLLDK